MADRILSKIDEVETQYYRLLIVAAPIGAGKTTALQLVSNKTGASLVNVNMEITRELLVMSERQRSVKLPKVLEEVTTAATTGHALVLLDNLEVLFDSKLKQDPLRLLQHLSRNRTIIAAWPGVAENREIIYADPEHPEYRRYPIRDFLVVGPELRR